MATAADNIHNAVMTLVSRSELHASPIIVAQRLAITATVRIIMPLS